MFDFIRKKQIWAALDAGLDGEITSKLGFQLKTMQDLAVFSHLKDVQGKVVGEIGGGDSRILPRIAESNECYNIEPFEGADNGPASEILISGVQNIRSVVGHNDPKLADSKFDVLFSVSVVEHVADADFANFWSDCIRILKPNGIMIHAIDMYISDSPSEFWLNRFAAYRDAIINDSRVRPIAEVFNGSLQFQTDMVSNPDNVMYNWKKISPALNELRQISQSVSLLLGVAKV